MSSIVRRSLGHTSCRRCSIRPSQIPYTTTGVAGKFNHQDLKISSGEDKETVAREAIKLIDQGKWKLCSDGAGIERTFRFKAFAVTWVRRRTFYRFQLIVHPGRGFRMI